MEVTNLITDHWYVEVKQNTPLILKSTLKKICKGENSCFVYQTEDKEVSLSMNTPIQLESREFKDNGKGEFVLIWGKERALSLFFSGLKQKTTIGTYVSELEFNLINAL